jgi:transcriptional regulator with XRE-family HTH domain
LRKKNPGRLFAQRLRELRGQAGISQEKLAEKADLHRNTVGIIERGKQIPTLDVIVKLAHALNMKPYQLIDHIP